MTIDDRTCATVMTICRLLGKQPTVDQIDLQYKASLEWISDYRREEVNPRSKQNDE